LEVRCAKQCQQRTSSPRWHLGRKYSPARTPPVSPLFWAKSCDFCPIFTDLPPRENEKGAAPRGITRRGCARRSQRHFPAVVCEPDPPCRGSVGNPFIPLALHYVLPRRATLRLTLPAYVGSGQAGAARGYVAAPARLTATDLRAVPVTAFPAPLAARGVGLVLRCAPAFARRAVGRDAPSRRRDGIPSQTLPSVAPPRLTPLGGAAGCHPQATLHPPICVLDN
jgi:hypothetical protein